MTTQLNLELKDDYNGLPLGELWLVRTSEKGLSLSVELTNDIWIGVDEARSVAEKLGWDLSIVETQREKVTLREQG